MIKIDNVVTPSVEQWKAVIMGARNPLNSWDISDSKFGNEFELGEKDHDLLMRLSSSGTDHRKFMRMITVYCDISAPFYWWKEFDTYKVGTVVNSCSTMHKLTYKKFEIYDFSHEHLDEEETGLVKDADDFHWPCAIDALETIVGVLNAYRDLYLKTKEKKYWWQIIQLLPSSYNQKRTVLLNYEVLANIYKSRQGHKLDEWNEFCYWIESLPYSELIIGAK